jgi:hypothetical protein
MLSIAVDGEKLPEPSSSKMTVGLPNWVGRLGIVAPDQVPASSISNEVLGGETSSIP